MKDTQKLILSFSQPFILKFFKIKCEEEDGSEVAEAHKGSESDCDPSWISHFSDHPPSSEDNRHHNLEIPRQLG